MRSFNLIILFCFTSCIVTASFSQTKTPVKKAQVDQQKVKKAAIKETVIDYEKLSRELHDYMDHWHMAAAQADGIYFFECMTDSAIFIGTDAEERWTKPQFMAYAKPFFDKGRAWDFKPYDRDLHVTKDGRYAWFSELLTTWMGVCRGSGMLVKTEKGWKIEQYHLSVTVPNKAIKDFISLVGGYSTPQK
jgi:hypothetical protein